MPLQVGLHVRGTEPSVVSHAFRRSQLHLARKLNFPTAEHERDHHLPAAQPATFASVINVWQRTGSSTSSAPSPTSSTGAASRPGTEVSVALGAGIFVGVWAWLSYLRSLEIVFAGYVSETLVHEGKEELVIATAPATRYTVDLGSMTRQMAELVEKNVPDPTLNDRTVSAVMLMATLKQYFDYTVILLGCGIPRVNLVGEKSHWESILGLSEKLKEYGLETIAWYHLLRPVISRFVGTFNDPSNPDSVKFWQRVAHLTPGGSGTGSRYTGGSPCLRCLPSGMYPTRIPPRSSHPDAEVDIPLIDNGVRFDCAMVTGSVGMRVTSSGDQMLSPHGKDDTLFVKDEDEERMRGEAKEAAKKRDY
ncbi:hypothetical protein C8R45DRAFT_937640 [Mycena sanguinolenta]|nr:hypothetical protein C8R45DRAFT_937640 [Mycena sanguinolenta]